MLIIPFKQGGGTEWNFPLIFNIFYLDGFPQGGDGGAARLQQHGVPAARAGQPGQRLLSRQVSRRVTEIPNQVPQMMFSI